MATRKATTSTPTTDLKARLAALGCELLEENGTHAERYNVFDTAKRKLVSVGQPLEEVAAWIEVEEAERSGAAAVDDETPIERARDEAQRATYEIRFLLDAARKLADDDATREIGAVLAAASVKLAALSEALDFVNFGKRGAA